MMPESPQMMQTGPTPPAPILPLRVLPVAPPSPKKVALLARIARLKRQVVVSSIVLFAVVLGFVSGAWQGVGTWVSDRLVATSQASDDGTFFNQGGGTSGGSNVGSSGGQAPVSGSGGS